MEQRHTKEWAPVQVKLDAIDLEIDAERLGLRWMEFTL
jgi:hypothetical protein